MKRTFDTFEGYIGSVARSCPDPYPETFAHYMAGVWYREGHFNVRQKRKPARSKYPAFWEGFESKSKVSVDGKSYHE